MNVNPVKAYTNNCFDKKESTDRKRGEQCESKNNMQNPGAWDTLFLYNV